jgi:5-formyltetrahydrofolate cyclo-ligase
MKDKIQIRKEIKDLKQDFPENQKQEEANAVFLKIESFPEFIHAKTILMYWSLPDELPTHRFIEKWSNCKQIVLPAIQGDKMIIKTYSSTNLMKISLLGISEPDLDEIFNGKIDVVIVPGIAFDTLKNRLGRGKGYYDRFLERNNLLKIGICFDFQLLETVPYSVLDVKMDIIVTPGGVY